jgi:DNA repair photolyase
VKYSQVPKQNDTSYCYVPSVLRGHPWGELRFDKKALEENLGTGNFIFVGSSTDMWASEVPKLWINETLLHCYDYDNKYLFQTKNPGNYEGWKFPESTILACTIETNRYYQFSKAPNGLKRKTEMANIALQKMISIEPIMDFDLDDMLRWIEEIAPEFVSIGADSKHHHLPEPSPEKVEQLIEALQGITEVYIKENLARLRI